MPCFQRPGRASNLGQAIFPSLPPGLACPGAERGSQSRVAQQSRSDAEGALDGETRRLKMHATPTKTEHQPRKRTQETETRNETHHPAQPVTDSKGPPEQPPGWPLNE